MNSKERLGKIKEWRKHQLFIRELFNKPDDEKLTKDWPYISVDENDFDWLVELADQSQKYRIVIRHLENAYEDMSKDETIGKDDWLGGWAAAVDFIEENIDWEETDEAKTIVEENKELSDRVQELEKIKDAKIAFLNKGDEEKRYIEKEKMIELEQQNKRYREAMKEAKDEVKHLIGDEQADKVYRILDKTLECEG